MAVSERERERERERESFRVLPEKHQLLRFYSSNVVVFLKVTKIFGVHRFHLVMLRFPFISAEPCKQKQKVVFFKQKQNEKQIKNNAQN